MGLRRLCCPRPQGRRLKKTCRRVSWNAPSTADRARERAPWDPAPATTRRPANDPVFGERLALSLTSSRRRWRGRRCRRVASSATDVYSGEEGDDVRVRLGGSTRTVPPWPSCGTTLSWNRRSQV